LVVSVVKICRQCLQTTSLLGDFPQTAVPQMKLPGAASSFTNFQRFIRCSMGLHYRDIDRPAA